MIWQRHSAVLLGVLFFAGTLSIAAEGGDTTADRASSFEQNDSSSTLFKMEQKSESTRIQARGTATDRKYTGNETGSFGLEALLGHLFLPENDQYQGYYFMTGKLESDNRQRFNATLGYFVPRIGGEAKLTYRLLHAEVHDNLPLTGEFEKGALEQGAGLYYKKRYNLPLKELTFDYAYTRLGGESVRQGPYNFDTPALWEQADIITGFGDIETQNGKVEASFGTDALDNPVVQGYRFDLGGGYQEVKYGEFYTVSEITDGGFTGIAGLQICTPFGVVKGGYQDMQSADTAYGGFQLGGLDLYYKNIQYEHGSDEQVLGIAFTVDLFDPGAAFTTGCRPFFYPSDTGYSSVYQMGHLAGLESDEFTARKVNEIKDGGDRIDKTRLPPSVRLDGSGDPRIIVTTQCSLLNVRSVEPATAHSAFSVNGNEMYISLAGLPEERQAVVAQAAVQEDRNCCGYTQVTLMTDAGSLVVQGVDVQEGLGCQPRQNGGSCSADTMCQSGYCSPAGICEGNTGTGQACTDDAMCLSGYCGPAGTCEGTVGTGQMCMDDYQCSVGNCYVHPRTNIGYCDGGLTTGLSSARDISPDPFYPNWSCNTCQYDFQCDSFNCGPGGSNSNYCGTYPQGNYCLP